MALVEIKVPDIGDVHDVAVIEVLVQVGDTIKAEQSLVTVESDKASMEIPASQGGVVQALKVKLGDKVNEGDVLVMLEVVDGAAAAPAAPSAAPAQVAPAAAPVEAPAAVPAPAAAPVAPVAGAASLVEVFVPDIGDFAGVSVIELLVKPGDTVQADQSLITVESDKASMEIPSSHAGVVKALKVSLGDQVKQGSLIAVLEVAGAAAGAGASASAAASAAAPAVSVAPVAAPVAASTSVPAAVAPVAAASASAPAAVPAHDPTAAKGQLPHASPSVRKFARELGVPLAEVKGSGPKGRITQGDVQGFVKVVMTGDVQTTAQKAKAPAAAAAPVGGGIPGLLPWPQVDFTKFGEIESVPLSRIKKISGANLARNWVMIPAVTYHEDADITDLEAFRVQINQENAKAGVKVTMLAFLIKACVKALQQFPEFNSSLDGDNLVYKKYFHIGFAADTPNGLVVPVVRNADQKSVLQIAAESAELAKKARDGKLGPADMTGACFTISSLGGIGGTYFSPIINAPEVAILGVNKSAQKPVWDGQAFVSRLTLPMSLSADHRVIDGATATRFNVYLASLLADFRRIVL